MHVLITGAGGFIGRALTRALIEAGALTDAAGDRRRIEGLTLAEIAEVQAVPLGTAKTRLFHARRKLKAALSGDDP